MSRLNPIPPRWHLLTGYLAIMGLTLISSATAIYLFFRQSLYAHMRQELLTLAETAAPALPLNGADNELLTQPPWRNLSHRNQSLEWFDNQGVLLSREGSLFSGDPLTIPIQPWETSIDSGQTLYSAILPIIIDTPPHQDIGYVRATISDQSLHLTLIQLRWGLALGSLIALSISGLGGLWLAHQATIPITQSYRRLQQFTADASHELRSPLTVIKTSVSLLLKHLERLPSSEIQKVNAIARASRHMTRLIEDLLLLARQDIASITFQPIPLHELLKELVETLELQADAKQISLSTHIATPIVILGDSSHLIRLFSNLLENALYYTPPQGSIHVTLTHHNAPYRTACITITDTGIGISPQDLPHIFDRFWRGDPVRSHPTTGTGLGLSIAQSIAQQHGGDISVRSHVGEGSSFRVRLPLKL